MDSCCRQVEILRVCAYKISLRDMAELEHYENISEAHLCWNLSPSVKEALPILDRCQNLRRLTLEKLFKQFILPFKELCGFIMKMKHLTFLHIIYINSDPCDHFKSEVDEVNAFVSPRRPNFKFDISCCEKSQVNSCFNNQHLINYKQCWLHKIIRSLSFIFALICMEHQMNTFFLYVKPNCYYTLHMLCYTYTNYKENWLVCLSNQGDFHILGLPDLRRQMHAQAIRREDIQ